MPKASRTASTKQKSSYKIKLRSKNIDYWSLNWPKTVTELHVHLGGSVPIYRLWELAVERGIRGMGMSYEDFVDLLKIQPGKVKDLESYLEVYDKVEQIQSGPNALRESIIISIHRAYRTGGMPQVGPGGEGGSPTPLFNIGRYELRLNPMKRTGAVFLRGKHAGLYDVDRVIKAACDAVDEVQLAFRGKLQVGLIFCFGRDVTYDANMILAEKTRIWKERSPHIIGVDLAGPESANTLSSPKALREAQNYFNAAGRGLGRTIHVGETPHVDLKTFLNTIETLMPQRVAHPIVALKSYWNKKDDRGLKLLKERGIVCELCVQSNLLTRAVKDIKEHGRMIATLDDFEIPYTFSTDAPSLQVSSLAEELLVLLRSGAASPEQIMRALKVADEASFLPRTNQTI
jgi:adenosine deaminase